MQFGPRSFPCTFLSLLLAAGATAMAGPVTPGQAQDVVSRWLQVTPRPLKTAMKGTVGQVLTHADDTGRALFHEVRLAGGGFVVVAPDDLLEPVIAFSPTGRLTADASGLLNRMLRRDLPKRLDRMKKSFTLAASRGQGEAPAPRKWALLQGSQASAADGPPSLYTVDDVRVEPLLASQWSQLGVAGYPTFNYFAPNLYYSGCLATAMGQIMRFRQFPTQGIGVRPFTIQVDGIPQTVTTRGGDGLGGPYDWSEAMMPTDPSAITEDAQRQMIGSLLFDAAASVGMSFTGFESTAVTGNSAAAMRNTFGYSNAVFGFNGGAEMLGKGLLEMVQPNLDLGLPVLLGIGGDFGHAVVCDGYGYNAGSLYHHLNLGWGDDSNVWYNLPNIGTFDHFDVVNGCLYNLFTTGTGDILSGRVTDGAGNPVAGAQVTNGPLTATTNAQGIYGLIHAVPGIHTITASKDGAPFTQAVQVMEKASSDFGAVGNLWGLNLIQAEGVVPSLSVQPLAQEAKVGGTATFTAGATGTGPFQFQWTQNGTPVGQNSPIYTTGPASIQDDLSQVQVRVTNPQGAALSAPAPLTVSYLLNGGFERGHAGWDLYDPSVILSSGAYPVIEPFAGSNWLCVGDWTQPTTDFARQDFAIPAEATSASLTFQLGIVNKIDAPEEVANVFKVMVLDAGGKVLATLLTRDNTDAETTDTGQLVWKPMGPFNMLAFKGQAATLRIESVQGGGPDTGTVFAVDEVKLTVATSTAGPVSPGAITMLTGAQLPFTANIVDFSADNRVNWSVSGAGGTFNPVQTVGDGFATTLFTGGSVPGTFTVTASPLETSATGGQATVTLVSPESVVVTVAPAATTLFTGAVGTFTADVGLLTDKSTVWSSSGGTFATTSNGGATWFSSTPGSFTLTASSSAVPFRSASVQVTVVDDAVLQLVMDRPAVTALPDSEVPLTVTGDQGAGVDWTVTAPATHVDNGTTTTVIVPAARPLRNTVYLVTATHKLDLAKAVSATITVKGSDLNNDGGLDPEDLLTVAGEWGRDASSPANLKGSGTVDDTDLNAFLSQM